MSHHKTETWDLWYPKAGATGIPFGRGRIAAGATTLLIHAAPQVLTATVYGDEGQVLALGKDLQAAHDTPISRLTRDGATMQREDIWPGEQEIGQLVMLPGGEVGTLRAWWHAGDHSEWRWQVELYNRRQ
jgi:hypothetical protein